MNANTRNILIAAVLLPFISYGISYQHQVVRQKFEDAARLKAEKHAEWKRNYDRDIENKLMLCRLRVEAEERQAEKAASEARMAARRIEQDKQRKIDDEAEAVREAKIAAVMKERDREMDTIRLDIACRQAADDFRKKQGEDDAAFAKATMQAEQAKKDAVRLVQEKKAAVKAAALQRQATLKSVQSQKQGKRVVVPSSFGN
jgi:hypothetical protein